MIFDLQNGEVALKSYEKFDVVVVGAGAAGITIAKRLEGFGKSVALIEGGGTEYSEQSQDAYKGQVTGDPYFELNVARTRYFGGSTNCWAGWCRSFDEVDFQRRSLGIEYVWPIKYTDVDRYKEDACSILEIPSTFADIEHEQSGIKSIEFQFSPPVRFKEKYIKDLEVSRLITVFLNSNLTSFKGSSRNIQAIIINSHNGNELSLSGEKGRPFYGRD